MPPSSAPEPGRVSLTGLTWTVGDNYGNRINAALDVAAQYAGIEGDEHRMWVIDQMVRHLLGCAPLTVTGADGEPCRFTHLAPSRTYVEFVQQHPDWNTGVAP